MTGLEENADSKQEEENAKQNEPTKRGHGISLQISCNKELRLT